jgi:hypothetical protein
MMKPLVFAIALFLHSMSLLSPIEAKSVSEYTIINTGIKAGGCWYDDSHFVILKGKQAAPGQDFEAEGLYYLDPAKPKDLIRLDLSPIDSNFQKHIRDVTCQDQTILFHLLSADKKRNTVYSLKVGGQPTVLAEKRDGFVLPQAVSIRGQYVLSFSNALGEPEAQHSSLPEQALKDCHFANLQDGYRAVCLRHDRGTKRTWLVNNSFVVQYVWDQTIRVNTDGQDRWVPNPNPPLKLPDGTELKQGYLLRDLENRIVQEIPMKQGLYRMDAINFKPNPDGGYLYAPCSKAGDYDRPKTFYGRVCRFKLAGIDTQWEEVFSLQKAPNERATLDTLDVNEQGDVVVLRRANHALPTLWKYIVGRANVEPLPIRQLSHDVGGIQLTPDGQTISYVDKGQLFFVRPQGGKP